jgi:hypothetical protein
MLKSSNNNSGIKIIGKIDQNTLRDRQRQSRVTQPKRSRNRKHFTPNYKKPLFHTPFRTALRNFKLTLDHKGA